MEMNWGIAIVGMVSLLIFILPLVLMERSKKGKEKQQLQALKNLAQQYNCQISQHEFTGNYAIGIDEARNFVFFYQQLNDKVIEHSINLADYLSCRIINSSSTSKNNGGSYKTIDKLELSFRPMDKNKQEEVLTFYNVSDTLQLVGELQSIEKWSTLINDRMKHIM